MTAQPLAPATSRARPRMTPAQYVTAIAGQVGGGEKCSARLASLVLHAIADRADWAAWSWGEHSYRSAEMIAASIGYTDRAVRYAYKVLVAGGWLRIEDRPGRTNVFTVLAPVDAPEAAPAPMWTRGGRRVRNHLRAVDNPVDDDASPASAARSSISGGGESSAADLGNPPTDTPPEGSPPAGTSSVDGAVAPAQAAPRARPPSDPRSEPPATVLGRSPSTAASTDAEREPCAGTPPPALGEHAALRTSVVGASRRLGWGDPPSGWARGAVEGQPVRRDALRRTTRCSRCNAPPGEACRGRGGALRRSNHRGRGS